MKGGGSAFPFRGPLLPTDLAKGREGHHNRQPNVRLLPGADCRKSSHFLLLHWPLMLSQDSSSHHSKTNSHNIVLESSKKHPPSFLIGKIFPVKPFDN